MNLLFGLCWFWRISLLFRWWCQFFHFLVYNINLTSLPEIMYSNLSLFTTACFVPMWSFHSWIRVGGATCCSTCLRCFIQKTGFIWRRLRYTFLSFLSGLYFSVEFLKFWCTLLTHLIFHDCFNSKTFFT